jgi:hypothetical protein
LLKRAMLVAATLCAALSCARKPAAAIPAPVVLDVGPPGQTDGVPRLQDAIDAAPAGAVLRLAAGTFHGPLVISRPLTLIGQGAGRTLIEGGPAGPTVEVRAEQVELRGLSLSGGSSCLAIEGGAGHRLAEVELRGASDAGLVARGARLVFAGGAVREIGGARSGRGIDLDGGSIEAKGVVFRAAGRRAVVLKAARGLFEDLDVRGPALSALQITSGSEARVVRGRFQGLDGAALYARASRLQIAGAVVEQAEYGAMGFRNAEVSVRGGAFSGYRVAGIALVGSHGGIREAAFSGGGSEGAISINFADGDSPVVVADNRMRQPGPFGVHVTESSVTVRGNSITGARSDREGDLGDGIFAIDSRLVAADNVLRGNAGSGIAVLRSKATVFRNGFIENGRAGMLLLDRSKGTAGGNLFLRNARSGVELGEAASVQLERNRFAGNAGFDVDAGCGATAGSASLDAPVHQRSCQP